MQNICLSLNLLKLYVIPILKQAGKDGGTAVVNKSKNLSIISLALFSPSTNILSRVFFRKEGINKLNLIISSLITFIRIQKMVFL